MSDRYKQDADIYIISPPVSGDHLQDYLKTIQKLGDALHKGGAEVIYTDPTNINHTQDPFIQVAPGVYAYAAGPNNDRVLDEGYLALKQILEEQGGLVIPIPIEYGIPSEYEQMTAEGLVEPGSEEAKELSKERESFSVLAGGNFIFDNQRNLLLVGDNGHEALNDEAIEVFQKTINESLRANGKEEIEVVKVPMSGSALHLDLVFSIAPPLPGEKHSRPIIKIDQESSEPQIPGHMNSRTAYAGITPEGIEVLKSIYGDDMFGIHIDNGQPLDFPGTAFPIPNEHRYVQTSKLNMFTNIVWTSDKDGKFTAVSGYFPDGLKEIYGDSVDFIEGDFSTSSPRLGGAHCHVQGINKSAEIDTPSR